jgi:hypothetical protein
MQIFNAFFLQFLIVTVAVVSLPFETRAAKSTQASGQSGDSTWPRECIRMGIGSLFVSRRLMTGRTSRISAGEWRNSRRAKNPAASRLIRRWRVCRTRRKRPAINLNSSLRRAARKGARLFTDPPKPGSTHTKIKSLEGCRWNWNSCGAETISNCSVSHMKFFHCSFFGACRGVCGAIREGKRPRQPS